MRHSDIDLTMGVYTDPKLLDVRGALDALPALLLGKNPNEREAVRATGTDGGTAARTVAPTVAPTPDNPSNAAVISCQNGRGGSDRGERRGDCRKC